MAVVSVRFAARVRRLRAMHGTALTVLFCSTFLGSSGCVWGRVRGCAVHRGCGREFVGLVGDGRGCCVVLSVKLSAVDGINIAGACNHKRRKVARVANDCDNIVITGSKEIVPIDFKQYIPNLQAVCPSRVLDATDAHDTVCFALGGLDLDAKRSVLVAGDGD